jgi:hypothetical protein
MSKEQVRATRREKAVSLMSWRQVSRAFSVAEKTGFEPKLNLP